MSTKKRMSINKNLFINKMEFEKVIFEIAESILNRPGIINVLKIVKYISLFWFIFNLGNMLFLHYEYGNPYYPDYTLKNQIIL